MPVNDTPLIEAIQQGDQKALATLYDAYSGALNGVILRVVRNNDLAQEVLQDTFVKIWRSAGAYDPAKGRPFTWMMNIARNAAIDMVRSAAVRHSGSVRSLDDVVYRTGHDDVREQMDDAGVKDVVMDLKPGADRTRLLPRLLPARDRGQHRNSIGDREKQNTGRPFGIENAVEGP